MTRVLRSLRATALLTIVIVLSAACSTQANVPDGVTVESVRAVRLGMSRPEVERLLGPPVYVQEGDPKYVGPGKHVLVYFRRMEPLVWRYPKLWVHLRHGRVEEVYAKRQNFGDDEAVYALNARRSFEGKLFRETFPSSKR